MIERVWDCKIGGEVDDLPAGSDLPMREAVQRAFRELTGVDARFTFSGWGGSLTTTERAVVNDDVPTQYPFTYTMRMPFGWNSSAPLYAQTTTDDPNDAHPESVIEIRDVNGAGIARITLNERGQLTVTDLTTPPPPPHRGHNESRADRMTD